MSNHDDFIDEYIEYRMFEESMKQCSGGGKPPKRNAGKSGCGTWCVIIAVAVILLSVFGSCSNNNRKSYTSSRSSYSTSSSASSSRKSYSGSSSNSYQSKTTSSAVQSTTKKSTYKSYSSKSSKTEDEYIAKDYVDADDFYYDHYDDFYDYEDAEDYWEEHQND